jgi:uncharacterized integral membrane protein
MSITKNVYTQINKTLDRKITTLGQAVSMSNYETNINNQIILILSSISGLLFLILIIVFIYYNYVKAERNQQ